MDPQKIADEVAARQAALDEANKRKARVNLLRLDEGTSLAFVEIFDRVISAPQHNSYASSTIPLKEPLTLIVYGRGVDESGDQAEVQYEVPADATCGKCTKIGASATPQVELHWRQGSRSYRLVFERRTSGGVSRYVCVKNVGFKVALAGAPRSDRRPVRNPMRLA